MGVETLAGAVVDLHSHVLPGLDDGAATLADAVELARAASREGTAVLAATPHVSPRFPTAPERMEAAFVRVREAVAAAGLPIVVVPGGELALETVATLDDADLRRFGLGGERFLLVEFPYDAWPPGLAGTLASLHERGFGVVLAHPERNPVVQDAPQRLAGLVEAGTLVQVTAAELLTRRTAASRTAAALVEMGLAHLLASDAHRAADRTSPAAAAELLPEPLARWLCVDSPRAILAGAAPPPRPERRRRRGLRRA